MKGVAQYQQVVVTGTLAIVQAFGNLPGFGSVSLGTQFIRGTCGSGVSSTASKPTIR